MKFSTSSCRCVKTSPDTPSPPPPASASLGPVRTAG
jgi:hypothetical protein